MFSIYLSEVIKKSIHNSNIDFKSIWNGDLGIKSKHLIFRLKKSFGLWFQIINQNKGVVYVTMYFLNKIVELLKSEHRSKSIADCWLHIETTCLFDPDWVSKQGCCCFAGSYRQAIVALSKANSFRLLQQPKLFAQSGSNSTTSKSRDWEIEIGAVVSLLSSISNTVLPAVRHCF